MGQPIIYDPKIIQQNQVGFYPLIQTKTQNNKLKPTPLNPSKITSQPKSPFHKHPIMIKSTNIIKPQLFPKNKN